MDLFKCVFLSLACCAIYGVTLASPATSSLDDSSLFDKGYRALYRVYEECQHRNVAVSPCLKKKAITFFDRLRRIDTLPIADNLELIKVPSTEEDIRSSEAELETTLGRNSDNKDEVLNEVLLERVASLMNSFNVQIRLPKTSPTELKRSIEEGRGKMKKMMGMMMMGMAMKMAALVPIAMMVLFLLAGKALIISKIALVLSLIIGLKKLLSQKQNNDHGHGGGGWQQSSSGWDRSMKGFFGQPEIVLSDADRAHAQNLAYKARQQR